MVLLNTTSFSGVSSQSINSIFSSTYDNYRIIFSELVGSTTINNVFLRLRKSGTDNTSNIYYRQVLENSSTSVNAARVTQTQFLAAVVQSTSNVSAVLDVFSPNVATQRTGCFLVSHYDTPANITSVSAPQVHDLASSADFDGFTFLTAGGTVTGKVSVYGYNK